MAKKDRNYYLDRVRAEREMALLTRDPANVSDDFNERS